MYPYGIIGNCQVIGLVDNRASLDWLCLPRPDSPPVFGRLLDPDGGFFSIEVKDASTHSQYYLPNTNVLVTEIGDRHGGAVRVVDFCPRGNKRTTLGIFRPAAAYRKVEPLSGKPVISVKCKPVTGWKKQKAPSTQEGSENIVYRLENDGRLHLQTDAPRDCLMEERAFPLEGPLHFALSWDPLPSGNARQVVMEHLQLTVDHWRSYVKHLSTPTYFQKQVIRSALTLKLHCFEATGAILASATTSLPESPGEGRNWDYRFCWLRDAYFVLSAFFNLGHLEELEGFLRFLLRLALNTEELKPLYSLDLAPIGDETEMKNWAGYKGSGPVRVNNQAVEHVQNDVYGEMILALTYIFMDERLQHLRSLELQELLIRLAAKCRKSINVADAGLWELRDGWQPHTFTNLMCWAGLHRVRSLFEVGKIGHVDTEVLDSVEHAFTAVQTSIREGVIRNGPTDDTLDSSLLLAPILRYPDPVANRKTVLCLAEELALHEDGQRTPFLFRYKRLDDFGEPASSFVICSFWLVSALAKIGEEKRAMEEFFKILEVSNPLGLISEHYHPKSHEQLGNFPQTYSHVGLINAAFSISPKWVDIL